MCIRDRPENDQAVRPLPVRGEVAKRRQREIAALAGVLQACLLYTSDAADERSSVDLGGRRIIKKKKHQKSARAVGTMVINAIETQPQRQMT